jgi:hypothetical protein
MGYIGPEHALAYWYSVREAANRLGFMPWIGKVLLGWVISEKRVDLSGKLVYYYTSGS